MGFNGVVGMDGNTIALVIVDQDSGRIWNWLIEQNSSASRVFEHWLTKMARHITAISGRNYPELQTNEMAAICEKHGIHTMPASSTRETAAETMRDLALSSMRLGRLPEHLWWRAQHDACQNINQLLRAGAVNTSVNYKPDAAPIFGCHASGIRINLEKERISRTYLGTSKVKNTTNKDASVHEILTRSGIVTYCSTINVDVTYFPLSNLTRSYSKNECIAEEEQFRRSMEYRRAQRGFSNPVEHTAAKQVNGVINN